MDSFLAWYCRPELLEEIQGDLYELFDRESAKHPFKAKFRFTWNVFRFCRLQNIRRNKKTTSANYTIMFKNYLVIGFRNALQHRLNTGINIIGLSLAIGCAITVAIFIDNRLNADIFNTNIDRIYQVTNLVQKDDDNEDWSDSPILLGPTMLESESGIEAMTRIEYANAAVRYNETVFSEFIWFVDADFSKIFSFPVRKGNGNALAKKGNLMITEETAEKYFGSTDPIGQVLSVKFGNQVKGDFTIGAVFEKPYNSSLYPQILFSMEDFMDLKLKDTYDWSYLTDATFIMLKPSYDVKQLEGSMDKYRVLQNAASPEWVIEGFRFHPLRGLSGESHAIISAVSFGAHPAGLLSLGVIALILLVLACFNYMNVAVATAATRLKEIGIRKVMGGKKKEIVQQFLTENFLLCVFAVIAGSLISYLFFLPAFNSLYPITTPFSFTKPGTAVLVFGGLFLFIGFASGVYPAFYISSFTPISIMRGREKFGQRSIFSRVLLTFQFVLAFTAIVASFVFIDNSLYLRSRDWGYNHDQNVVVPVRDKEIFLALRDKAESNQFVSAVAGSANHIGYQNNRNNFEHLGKRFETVHFRVGFDYMEVMNLRLKSGRFFDEKISSDLATSVVVNEQFVKMMQWEKPLHQSFRYDSVRRFVVGVVEDFHYEGFYDPLGPVMFTAVPEEAYGYLSVKASDHHAKEVLEYLRSAWRDVAPDDPFDGFLQDDVFLDFHNDNTANIKLLSFISGMAIILGCLGLFGLVSFNITRRLKEFSVRKVFGASLAQIFRLMSRDYMWILIVAFGLGAPSGFFLMNMLIQHIYPDPQPAGILPFITAIAVMIATVGATVGSQMGRVSRENPAKTLRIE